MSVDDFAIVRVTESQPRGMFKRPFDVGCVPQKLLCSGRAQPHHKITLKFVNLNIGRLARWLLHAVVFRLMPRRSAGYRVRLLALPHAQFRKRQMFLVNRRMKW